MRALIRNINLPAAPAPTRAACRKPVICYDPKHLTVVELPSNMPVPRTYPFPKPTPERTARIQKSLEKTRKERKKVAPKVWTDEKVEKLIQLYNSGMSYKEMQLEMGVSTSKLTAKVHLLAEEGRIELRWSPKEFTDEEVKKIIEMRKKGMSYSKIGKALGRTDGSCSKKFREVMGSGKGS